MAPTGLRIEKPTLSELVGSRSESALPLWHGGSTLAQSHVRMCLASLAPLSDEMQVQISDHMVSKVLDSLQVVLASRARWVG